MSSDPIVRDNPAADRYEILVDGEVAGYTEHRPNTEGHEVFPHTLVEERFEGQGLASILVRGALDDLRAKGKLVVPRCPYVKRWIEKHPEYQDLVAPA